MRDRDGLNRNVPLLGRAGGYLTPSLALELVRIAEGEPPIRLIGDKASIRQIAIGRHVVPTMPGGQMRLRFRDLPPEAFTSAIDIAQGRVPPNQFTGRIVLIGLTSAGTTDVVITPREPSIYGVLVQAQAVDAILNSSALVRPAWAVWAEWLSGLAIVLAACAFLPHLSLRAIALLAIGIATAALGGAWLAFRSGLLVDPAPVVAPAFVAAMTMVSLLFVEENRMRERLRVSLAAERHEREAASQIQAGMLIPRARLKDIAPDVEIDAVLLPARTVGGDLYDVFRCRAGGSASWSATSPARACRPRCSWRWARRSPAACSASRRSTWPTRWARSATSSTPTTARTCSCRCWSASCIRTGRLEMCSAGHEDPFVIEPATARFAPCASTGGRPLCAMDGFPYPLERFRLEPGETLIAFTDGLTEAQDMYQDLFGARRVAAAIAVAARRPLGELVNDLVDAVRTFEGGGEPSDDLTILALRRPAA
jgi:hypothetical protein